jgi:hypothetical protein
MNYGKRTVMNQPFQADSPILLQQRCSNTLHFTLQWADIGIPGWYKVVLVDKNKPGMG